MSLVNRWSGKLRRHRARLTKFGAIGLVGVVADVGGFNVLRYAGLEPLTAKFISTALGILVSWVGNRYWTFSATKRQAIRREFVMFLIVCLVGLGISLGMLFFTHYVLDLRTTLDDNLSTNVIGLGLATAFRYWAMHKHVFTGTPPAKKAPGGKPATSSTATKPGPAAPTPPTATPPTATKPPAVTPPAATSISTPAEPALHR